MYFFNIKLTYSEYNSVGNLKEKIANRPYINSAERIM